MVPETASHEGAARIAAVPFQLLSMIPDAHGVSEDPTYLICPTRVDALERANRDHEVVARDRFATRDLIPAHMKSTGVNTPATRPIRTYYALSAAGGEVQETPVFAVFPGVFGTFCHRQEMHDVTAAFSEVPFLAEVNITAAV